MLEILTQRCQVAAASKSTFQCLCKSKPSAASFPPRPSLYQKVATSRQYSTTRAHRASQAVLSASPAQRLPARAWQPLNNRKPLGSRGVKTIEQANARAKIGPFSVLSVVIFLGTGLGMTFYFRWEKARMERVRIAEMSKGVGKPRVGGPFQLVDQNGKEWDSTSEMDGKFSLVYFGFSHCPDICPEELDKMAQMLDIVSNELPSSSRKNPDLLPIFITCDPARDTPEVLKSYLKEFHPNLVGLTGAWEQIKTVCKLYRVYFSTPPGVKPGMDYLVDHSIYFYLMDPEGDFVEAIGRQHTAEQGAKLMIEHMSDWRGKVKKS